MCVYVCVYICMCVYVCVYMMDWLQYSCLLIMDYHLPKNKRSPKMCHKIKR